MAVRRVVANVASDQLARAHAFYVDILGMRVAMDMGWIITFVADTPAPPQISVAVEGGSGTAVPDLSIEVDDLEEVLARIRDASIAVEYGPVDEPWGVRRFLCPAPEIRCRISGISRPLDLWFC